MPGRDTQDDLPRFVLDLDDITDVEDLELPDVKTPERQPRAAAAAQDATLALGSELRPRVIAQNVPNDLDLALMAYLLDIDVPPDPPDEPAPAWPEASAPDVRPPSRGDDESVDESPTPRFRPR